jgi:hypothetical protein
MTSPAQARRRQHAKAARQALTLCEDELRLRNPPPQSPEPHCEWPDCRHSWPPRSEAAST